MEVTHMFYTFFSHFTLNNYMFSFYFLIQIVYTMYIDIIS